MTKRSIAFLSVLLFCVPGMAADGPVDTHETEALSPLSTTLSLGYDSRYVLYGYRLSRHLYHADVYSSYALTDRTSLWAGAWYGYLTDGTYRELDGYAGLDQALDGEFSVGVGLSFFRYIEVPFSDEDWDHEVAMHVSYVKERLFLSVREQYSHLGKGHLLRLLAGYTQPLTDRLSFQANAEFGYAFQYYIEGNRPHHAIFTLKLPYRVTDTVYVTPFIARTLALDAIDLYEEDDTYGGVAASWTL